MNPIPQSQARPERTSRSPSASRRVAGRISAIVRSAVASSSTPGVLVTTTPRALGRLDVDVVVADRDVGDAAQLRPGGVEQLLVDPVAQQGEDRVGPGDQLEQLGARGRRLPLVDPHLAGLPQQLERRLRDAGW